MQRLGGTRSSLVSNRLRQRTGFMVGEGIEHSIVDQLEEIALEMYSHVCIIYAVYCITSVFQ